MKRQSVASLAGLGALLVGMAAATVLTTARPSVAQQRCYQVASYVAPNLLRCQQVGQDHLGRPIWMCC